MQYLVLFHRYNKPLTLERKDYHFAKLRFSCTFVSLFKISRYMSHFNKSNSPHKKEDIAILVAIGLALFFIFRFFFKKTKETNGDEENDKTSPPYNPKDMI